ncbi:hypothetical protein NUH16_003065 [Penicillium rubens]|nr:hypothetical protein NUH16_003065 [Penicillium rubens]
MARLLRTAAVYREPFRYPSAWRVSNLTNIEWSARSGTLLPTWSQLLQKPSPTKVVEPVNPGTTGPVVEHPPPPPAGDLPAQTSSAANHMFSGTVEERPLQKHIKIEIWSLERGERERSDRLHINRQIHRCWNERRKVYGRIIHCR